MASKALKNLWPRFQFATMKGQTGPAVWEIRRQNQASDCHASEKHPPAIPLEYVPVNYPEERQQSKATGN